MDTTRQTTVLFADVSGSTKLYEAAGDAKALEAIQHCLERLRRSSEAFGGRVVKTIGDEVMVLFPSPDAAAAFARADDSRAGGLLADVQALLEEVKDEIAAAGVPASIIMGDRAHSFRAFAHRGSDTPYPAPASNSRTPPPKETLAPETRTIGSGSRANS